MSEEKNIRYKKLDSLQIMRGLFTLMVMMAHINLMTDKNWLHGAFIPGWCGVDLFFILSGFLTIYTYRPGRRVSDFIVKKFIRIYPVNIIFSTIILACNSILMRGGYNLLNWTDINNGGHYSIIASFLCLPTNVDINDMPILPPAWTLPYEVFFYIVEMALVAGGIKLFLSICGIWTTLIVAFLLVDIQNYYLRFFVSPLFLEFFIGMLIAELYIKYSASIRGSRTLPALLFFIGILGIGISWIGTVLKAPFILSINRVIKFGIPMALMIFGTVLLNGLITEKANSTKLGHFLTHCGDISFSIYLSHFLVVCMVNAVFNKLVAGMASTIKMLLLLVICYIVGALGYRIVEEPCTRYLKKVLKV